MRLLPLRGDPLVPILAATLGFRCASAYTEAVNAPVFDPHRPDDPPAPSTPCTAFSPGFHIPHFAGLLIAVLGLAACAMGASALAAGFHVATHGKDAWSGTLPAPNAAGSDGPFATVDRARMAIRQLKAAGAFPAGGVEVTVHGGLYRFARPLELTAEDSGTENAPIVYSAAPNEPVRWLGGITVTGFKAVTDSGVLSRLEESARGNVLEADLRAQGLTNYGDAGGGGLELFFRDEPMPLSRWPNTGFIKITEVRGKTPVDVRGTKGCVEGELSIAEDRPARWGAERDVWVHGYWFWDWSDQRQRLRTIDPAKRTPSTSSRPITTTAIAKDSGSTPTTCCPRSTNRASGIWIGARRCSTSGRRRRSRPGK